MSAKVSLPWARAPSTACCWVMPAGSCLQTMPSKMMLVALPRIFGPSTENTTLITPSSTTAISPRRSGLIRPQQPAGGRPEVQRLLGGHADAAAERTAAAGTAAAGRRRELRPFRRAPACVGVRHADTSALSWDSHDLGVRRAGLEQFVVPPAADDETVLQHDDLVGVDDGRHPLGDDDHRPVPGHRPERRPQPGVGGQVERRERVVEQVDARVRHQRPGDRQPLPLATGDVRPALRDRRLEAVRHGRDEVPRLGDGQGRPELLVRGVRVAVAQVGGDRPGEQEGLLGHQTDPVPERVRVVVADVDAVDRARRRPSRRTAGGSATAAWSCPAPVDPMIGGGGPGRGPQRDVPQHRLAGTRVAEFDRLEPDLADARSRV